MKVEQLKPELQAWFRTMIAQAFSREAALEALLAAGYEKRFADQAVEAAYASAPKPVPAPAPAQVVEQAEAKPDAAAQRLSAQLVEMPNSIETDDREIEMLFALEAPRVILFGNLLSAEECEQLIELSRGKLQRSSVVNAETGHYDIHPHRTSSGTHFARGENELVSRIEKRIADLVQCPVERGEPIQVLHYQPGAEYRPHYDYFDPANKGNDAVLAHGGQRIATLIMYLNDVEAGGSTVFPEIGLDVLPRRGHAVYFAYCAEDGRLDARTLHGGSPVTSGEKWIATKWFRQREYVGPGTAAEKRSGT
jgi:prolyl 4-hydroxylase